MIKRLPELESLGRLLQNFSVVGIVVARQVGKTTLAHAFAGRAGNQRIDVIHDGDDTFPLDEKIRAVSLSRLLTDVDTLG